MYMNVKVLEEKILGDNIDIISYKLNQIVQDRFQLNLLSLFGSNLVQKQNSNNLDKY